MGFAASQARFLSLTARLSDLEFEAQQISQQRLALAHETELAATAYQEATSNQIFYATVIPGLGCDPVEVALSYDVIVADADKGGLGMKLVTSTGKIVVTSEAERQSQIEASAGSQYPLSEADFFICEDVKDTDALRVNLEEGNMFISPKRKEDGEWDLKSPEQLASVRKDYDKTDDAAAEAEWILKNAKLEKLDSALEMRLNQVETEQKAITTEMDSIQKVIDENIEESYKSFA